MDVNVACSTNGSFIEICVSGGLVGNLFVGSCSLASLEFANCLSVKRFENGEVSARELRLALTSSR